MKQIFQEIIETLQETFAGYGRDNASMLAAGLAYYTIFAIAPLLVIAVAVAGFFYGDAAVQGQLVGAIGDTVGQEAAVIIENLVRNARESEAGVVATVLSVGLLLFGASGLFAQLQRALNTIWGITSAPDAGVLNVLRQRALAFGMVLVIGFFLLLSLTVTAVVSTLGDFLIDLLPGIGPLLPLLDIGVSLLLLSLLFAVLFRVLPDAKLAWRDVLAGGVLTAVLFTIGRYLISWYLSAGSPSSAYGAAGSLVAVLLFVYYSAQILLIGAEFTQVYANRYGEKMTVLDTAVQFSRLPGDSSPPVGPPSDEAAQQADRPPAPMPPPPAASPGLRQQAATERQLASGLLGLAFGLLLAFVFNRRSAES